MGSTDCWALSSSSIATQRTQLINVDNADAWLEYDREYKILFCRYHTCGIRNLQTHLRDYHAGTMAQKKAVVQRYSGFDIARPVNVKTPPPLQVPFEELGKPKQGWCCSHHDCDFISVNRDVIRQHCYGHGWRASKERPTYWHRVWVQCFFPSGGFQRYFVVDYSEPHEEDGSSRIAEHDAVLEDWNTQRKNYDAEMDIIAAETAKQDRTLWWKRTGWQEHLKECNLRHLSSASRLPGKDEGELQQVRKIVHELIETCVKGLRTLDLETRRWLRSAKRSEPDQRPLNRLQTEEGQHRYADYIVRFVCYSLRVWCSLEQPVGDAATEAVVDVMSNARDLFPWHGEQKALASRLWEALERGGGEEEQTQALHEFLQAVIYQAVRGDTFRSPLLHFLAVLSIDEEMGRLREANDFSYMLAGIVYCVRVLTVEDILPSASRETQNERDDARFLEVRLKCLADGGYSPMSKMLSLLAYGKHIGLNHQNKGSMFWNGDGVVEFRGRRIVIDDFRVMLDQVVSDAEDLLWEELMWTSKAGRFAIALDEMVDDVTYTKRGFSFLDDPVNRLQDTGRSMLDKMDAHPHGRKMRRDGQWQERQLRKYLRAVDRFREMLLFCMHLTGGQPGRGTEMTAIRFKNGFMQDRNIFVICGQVVVVTRYHKSQSQFDKPKVIPRFLPWRVGQLLVVYLAYVQDLAAFLRIKSGGIGFGEHLWADEKGVWETDRLTRVIARYTQEHLGTRLTTLEYRHVAIFVGRKVVGEGFARGFSEEGEDAEEAEVDEDDPLEMSAGRGGEVGANRYGVSMDVIKHLTDRTLAVFRPLSVGWHRFVGMESLGGSKKRQRQQSDEEQMDRQLARDGIGNWGRAMKRLRSGMQNGLCTPPTSSPVARSSPLVSSSAPASDGVEMDVRRRVSEDEVKQAMKKVLGRDAVEFRSQEQRESLLAVVNVDGRTPLVVVLPTGGGKSMMFMVPACLEDAGVTVVVVPFRALLDNLLAKAKAIGIDCAEWMHAATERATLMFVSADKVSGSGFVGHMKQWEQRGVLRRVILDEAHLAFKDNHWRAKLAGLRELRQTRCPLIMLTATLPVALEGELERSMVAQYARYIRCSTMRSRTRYIVEKVGRGTLQERVVALCVRVQSRLGPKRGVVYCKSRDQCEALAKELGVMHFMGQLADNPERLEHWLEHNGLIVATSALGTGVDFEKIVFTLHTDIPYGMVDFAQESGRGGRGGEDVDSLILCEEGSDERAFRRARNADERAIAGFVRTQGCRRKVMSLFLDGCEVACGQGNHARCDGCGEGLTALDRQHRREGRERRRFEEVMDRFTNCCASCWTANVGDQESWDHPAQGCRSSYTVEQVESFRRMLRFDPDTHSCFKCGISQKLCRTGEDSKQACQWPGRMAPLLHALVQQEARLHMLEESGYEGDSEDVGTCVQWLGQRHPRRVWNEVMSNGMAVLVKIIGDVQSVPSTPVNPVGIRSTPEGTGGYEVTEDEEDEEDEEAEEDEESERELASSPPVGRVVEEGGEGLIDLFSDGADSFEDEVEESGSMVVVESDKGSVVGSESSNQEEEAGRIREKDIDADELTALIESWRGRCCICWLHGLPGMDHQNWRECPDKEGRAAVEERLRWMRIQYRYSACASCHVPQAICRRWTGSMVGGRVKYRRSPGVGCQFKGEMREMAGAIWALRGKSGVEEWIAGEMGLQGTGDNADKENGGAQRVVEWFGNRFMEGGLELSGLCRMVWRFGIEGSVRRAQYRRGRGGRL